MRRRSRKGLQVASLRGLRELPWTYWPRNSGDIGRAAPLRVFIKGKDPVSICGKLLRIPSLSTRKAR